MTEGKSEGNREADNLAGQGARMHDEEEELFGVERDRLKTAERIQKHLLAAAKAGQEEDR